MPTCRRRVFSRSRKIGAHRATTSNSNRRGEGFGVCGGFFCDLTAPEDPGRRPIPYDTIGVRIWLQKGFRDLEARRLVRLAYYLPFWIRLHSVHFESDLNGISPA